MTNKEAKDVLLNYTCCCKYGTSPINCSDEECDFGKAIKTLCNRPQGEWYEFIPNCLKARHGEHVLYKVDFLLDNLAREVNIMESARRMKGGAE